MKKRIAVVGAGFSGAVIARELAEQGGMQVTVFEQRSHVAGNCHTYRDDDSGILVHAYGPHIFHTSRDDVWAYVQRFGRFSSYTNRVKAITNRGVFSMPINLLTLNQFFRTKMNPHEARAFLDTVRDRTITHPQNFEEQALAFVGKDIYETFFRGYTRKQWGVDPKQIPASVLQRLPLRLTYDDNYYNDRHQGIPIDGYTPLIESMLAHRGIEVRLQEAFDSATVDDFDHVFYSGPIDAFFGYGLGRLRYRTLAFERFSVMGDHQGNPVINYCEESIPYTRVSEHKHFAAWESHTKSVCFREFSKEAMPGDIPFYPLRLDADKALLQAYQDQAAGLPNVTFVGRLGTYRYIDMDTCVADALAVSRTFLTGVSSAA